MSQLLSHWLLHDAQVPVPHGSSLEVVFSNGYLFALLLDRYRVLTQCTEPMSAFRAHASTAADKLHNFRLLLPCFMHLGIPLDPRCVNEVMIQKPGSAQKVLVQLRAVLEGIESSAMFKNEMNKPLIGFAAQVSRSIPSQTVKESSGHFDATLRKITSNRDATAREEILLQRFRDRGENFAEWHRTQLDSEEKNHLASLDRFRNEERTLEYTRKKQRNQQEKDWIDRHAESLKVKEDRERTETRFELSKQEKARRREDVARKAEQTDYQLSVDGFERNLVSLGIGANVHSSSSSSNPTGSSAVSKKAETSVEFSKLLSSQFLSSEAVTKQLAADAAVYSDAIAQKKRLEDDARRERAQRRRKFAVEQQHLAAEMDTQRAQAALVSRLRRKSAEESRVAQVMENVRREKIVLIENRKSREADYERVRQEEFRVEELRKSEENEFLEQRRNAVRKEERLRFDALQRKAKSAKTRALSEWFRSDLEALVQTVVIPVGEYRLNTLSTGPVVGQDSEKPLVPTAVYRGSLELWRSTVSASSKTDRDAWTSRIDSCAVQALVSEHMDAVSTCVVSGIDSEKEKSIVAQLSHLAFPPPSTALPASDLLYFSQLLSRQNSEQAARRLWFARGASELPAPLARYRIAITGPPLSGKSELAKKLANTYSLLLVPVSNDLLNGQDLAPHARDRVEKVVLRYVEDYFVPEVHTGGVVIDGFWSETLEELLTCSREYLADQSLAIQLRSAFSQVICTSADVDHIVRRVGNEAVDTDRTDWWSVQQRLSRWMSITEPAIRQLYDSPSSGQSPKMRTQLTWLDTSNESAVAMLKSWLSSDAPGEVIPEPPSLHQPTADDVAQRAIAQQLLSERNVIERKYRDAVHMAVSTLSSALSHSRALLAKSVAVFNKTFHLPPQAFQEVPDDSVGQSLLDAFLYDFTSPQHEPLRQDSDWKAEYSLKLAETTESLVKRVNEDEKSRCECIDQAVASSLDPARLKVLARVAVSLVQAEIDYSLFASNWFSRSARFFEMGVREYVSALGSPLPELIVEFSADDIKKKKIPQEEVEKQKALADASRAARESRSWLSPVLLGPRLWDLIKDRVEEGKDKAKLVKEKDWEEHPSKLMSRIHEKCAGPLAEFVKASGRIAAALQFVVRLDEELTAEVKATVEELKAWSTELHSCESRAVSAVQWLVSEAILHETTVSSVITSVSDTQNHTKQKLQGTNTTPLVRFIQKLQVDEVKKRRTVQRGIQVSFKESYQFPLPVTRVYDLELRTPFLELQVCNAEGVTVRKVLSVLSSVGRRNAIYDGASILRSLSPLLLEDSFVASLVSSPIRRPLNALLYGALFASPLSLLPVPGIAQLQDVRRQCSALDFTGSGYMSKHSLIENVVMWFHGANASPKDREQWLAVLRVLCTMFEAELASVPTRNAENSPSESYVDWVSMLLTMSIHPASYMEGCKRALSLVGDFDGSFGAEETFSGFFDAGRTPFVSSQLISKDQWLASWERDAPASKLKWDSWVACPWGSQVVRSTARPYQWV
eukprot:ANDGO_07351.mRNA.1 hypothetical protein GUITHDRAFT_163903